MPLAGAPRNYTREPLDRTPARESERPSIDAQRSADLKQYQESRLAAAVDAEYEESRTRAADWLRDNYTGNLVTNAGERGGDVKSMEQIKNPGFVAEAVDFLNPLPIDTKATLNPISSTPQMARYIDWGELAGGLASTAIGIPGGSMILDDRLGHTMLGYVGANGASADPLTAGGRDTGRLFPIAPGQSPAAVQPVSPVSSDYISEVLPNLASTIRGLPNGVSFLNKVKDRNTGEWVTQRSPFRSSVGFGSLA